MVESFKAPTDKEKLVEEIRCNLAGHNKFIRTVITELCKDELVKQGLPLVYADYSASG